MWFSELPLLLFLFSTKGSYWCSLLHGEKGTCVVRKGRPIKAKAALIRRMAKLFGYDDF